jgi:hypothetical protein
MGRSKIILKFNTFKKPQILASKEKPCIVCLTCGLATHKVYSHESDTLRGEFPTRRYKGRVRVKKPLKRWARLIKPSDKPTTYQGKKCRKKAIYFSYIFMDCIKKGHKLSVRFRPFSPKLVTAFK